MAFWASHSGPNISGYKLERTLPKCIVTWMKNRPAAFLERNALEIASDKTIPPIESRKVPTLDESGEKIDRSVRESLVQPDP